MKKLSFALVLMAALCFAACGNNQNKKAEAAAVENTEACCEEATHSCCGEATGTCCGEESEEGCSKGEGEGGCCSKE